MKITKFHIRYFIIFCKGRQASSFRFYAKLGQASSEYCDHVLPEPRCGTPPPPQAGRSQCPGQTRPGPPCWTPLTLWAVAWPEIVIINRISPTILLGNARNVIREIDVPPVQSKFPKILFRFPSPVWGEEVCGCSTTDLGVSWHTRQDTNHRPCVAPPVQQVSSSTAFLKWQLIVNLRHSTPTISKSSQGPHFELEIEFNKGTIMKCYHRVIEDQELQSLIS